MARPVPHLAPEEVAAWEGTNLVPHLPAPLEVRMRYWLRDVWCWTVHSWGSWFARTKVIDDWAPATYYCTRCHRKWEGV